MNHTLHIQLSSCEGAVVRTLGLIERRGYSLNSCTISEPDGSGRNMEVSVTSSRPGDLLKRQLERLHDIHMVKLLPVVISHTRTPGIRAIDCGLSD
jgi:acetolactate synthase regulatory subunit